MSTVQSTSSTRFSVNNDDFIITDGKRDDVRKTESSAIADDDANDSRANGDPGVYVGIDLNEAILRHDLRCYFMNPIEKWRHRRRFPFKLLTLIVKIILVTVQLCVFAGNRNQQFDFLYGNKMSFSHLFLYGWDATREIKSYPPAAGPLAIYERRTFYQAIDYAITGYGNLTNAIGPYSYIHNATTGRVLPIELCKKEHTPAVVHRRSDGKPGVRTECCLLDVVDVNDDIDVRFAAASSSSNDSDDKDDDERPVVIIKRLLRPTEDPFAKCNITAVDFRTLIKVTLQFSLKATRSYSNRLRCTAFSLVIIYDNSEHVGRLLSTLDLSSYHTVDCRKPAPTVVESHSSDDDKDEMVDGGPGYTWQVTTLDSWLNYVVILICLISLVLCVRAVYRAQLLKRRTMLFFRLVRHSELNVECRLRFWNFWYLTIIANDIMIIVGTYMQEEIFLKGDARTEWTICSLLLGTGNLLVWFGVLRYFGFFKTYNVVMITVISAFPAVMRFMACAVLIYCGFMFCGWLVFGPYHMKFRTLSSTSECLFSLINGDDMFATFSIFEARSPLLIFYMRTYLYCFSGLFIYVILSLLLSIIIDAYETIKEYYEQGFPKTVVEEFIGEVDLNAADSDSTFLLPDSYDQRRGVTFKQFLVTLFTCGRRTS